MKIKLTYLILNFYFLILFSCTQRQARGDSAKAVQNTQQDSTYIDDSLIFCLSKTVLISIKNKDYKKFSQFIHQKLGIRFSPYAYVDTSVNMKFTPSKFMEEIANRNKFKWGRYDGSGASIFLTIENYFSKFVYNADFVNAEKFSLNKMIAGGNSRNNLEAVYSGCNYSESYFTGIDKKNKGMDWCCLRLVFKKENNIFYLVGLIHDQWTI